MKIVKSLFYEVLVAPLIYRFILWLRNEGYDEESNFMLSAMIIWANKKKHSLNAEKK